MRKALIDWLVEKVKMTKICLLTADLGYSVVGHFVSVYK